MRKIAIVLSFLCALFFYALSFLESSTVFPVKRETEISVMVDRLAYSEPEIVETVAIAPPIIQTEAEEVKIERSASVETEEVVPLNAGNIGDARCVVLGPLDEQKLPKLRETLKKNDLVAPMIIESLPARSLYGVSVGRYATREKALRKKRFLQGKGFKNIEIIESGSSGVSLCVEKFGTLNEAEIWARGFVNTHKMRNVKLIKIPKTEENRIQLVFPDIERQQVQALHKLSSRYSVSASLCPQL